MYKNTRTAEERKTPLIMFAIVQVAFIDESLLESCSYASKTLNYVMVNKVKTKYTPNSNLIGPVFTITSS